MKAGNYLVLAGSVMLSAWPFAARGAQPATRPYTTDPDGTRHALGLKSFDGIEESVVKYVVAEDKTQPQDFKHITDEGGGLMRMFLRANAQWWDGDQGTTRKDRQARRSKGWVPIRKMGKPTNTEPPGGPMRISRPWADSAIASSSSPPTATKARP